MAGKRQLRRIEEKLDQIMDHLGIEASEPDRVMPWVQPSTEEETNDEEDDE